MEQEEQEEKKPVKAKAKKEDLPRKTFKMRIVAEIEYQFSPALPDRMMLLTGMERTEGMLERFGKVKGQSLVTELRLDVSNKPLPEVDFPTFQDVREFMADNGQGLFIG